VLKLGEGGSSFVYNSLAQLFPWARVGFHSFCLCSPGDRICLVGAAVGDVRAFHSDFRKIVLYWGVNLCLPPAVLD